MHTDCSGDACSTTFNLCQNARSNMDSTGVITTSDPPGSVSSSSITTSTKICPISSCPSCPACTDSPTCPECPTCQTINGQVNTLTSQIYSQPPFVSDTMTTMKAVFTTNASMNTTCTPLVTATIGKFSPL